MINATTGVFTWTPGYGQAGDHTLHFTATDPSGATATIESCCCTSPTSSGRRCSTRPTTRRLWACRSLSRSRPPTWTPARRSVTRAINLPAGASINAQTGQFQWTPGPSQAGDYVVTLQVSDGQATSTQNILIAAAVQPTLPGVTIVLTPSFPAIPGQQVVVNAIAEQRGTDHQLGRHNQRPAGDPQCQRPAPRSPPAPPGQTLIPATATDAGRLDRHRHDLPRRCATRLTGPRRSSRSTTR